MWILFKFKEGHLNTLRFRTDRSELRSPKIGPKGQIGPYSLVFAYLLTGAKMAIMSKILFLEILN